MTEDITKVLTENVDEEVLNKMPEWFRMLRNAHRKRQEKLIKPHFP